MKDMVFSVTWMESLQNHFTENSNLAIFSSNQQRQYRFQQKKYLFSVSSV